jgi:hypothetical protein
MVEGDGGRQRHSHAVRQRALLLNMIRLTHEQRRYLVQGDLKRVEQTNRLLGALLESQNSLNEDATEWGKASEEEAAEMRRLAEELQTESRRNYLLACRGAEFARFSLSLLTEADPEGGADGMDDDGGRAPRGPRLVDRPA